MGITKEAQNGCFRNLVGFSAGVIRATESELGKKGRAIQGDQKESEGYRSPVTNPGPLQDEFTQKSPIEHKRKGKKQRHQYRGVPKYVGQTRPGGPKSNTLKTETPARDRKVEV